jgi:RND family efflux transporter MFP subunit
MCNTNFIIFIAACIIFYSCNYKKDKTHDGGTVHLETHEDENTVTLTAEQMKSINIEFGSIEKKQLTASLKANGILKVPNQNRADASVYFGGIIKSILVQTGNTVYKGQVIATISNNAFISMQEEYLSVTTKTALAEIELGRQVELQEGNAGALKNLQSADAELKILKARKASLQKQLEMIGINTLSLTNETIQTSVNVISPINGTISNLLVNIGSYVEANQPIAEIVDNSQLHVDLYVYEKDLQKIKVGQTIHFTLTNNPGKEYDADIYAISNTFEQNTKAIAVHATVKGNKHGLIDGMSITALVSLENATVNAVPTDAIVSHEGHDYIFVVAETFNEEAQHEHHLSDTDEHSHLEATEHNHDEHDHVNESVTFEKIPVSKGTTDIGYSEIILIKEIPANSKVVVHGAFFILSKMNNKGEAHAH